MKKKLQRLLTAIGFTVALAAAIFACSGFLEYKEAKEKYTDFYEAETNFDVIFMGTSHTYGTVYPVELWKEYGITSYNWGYNHCAVAENYHLMLEVVKRTKPKLFVVDLYGLLEYDNWEGTGNGKYRTDKVEEQHVQFDAVPFSREKGAAIRDIFDDYSQNNDFLWNFILYHNRWEDLGERDFTAEGLPLMGATIYSGVGSHGPFTPTETETVELEHIVGYEYLIKMMEFCGENGIQLLCTYLPYPAKPASQKVANSLGAVINRYPNCSYINMLDADYLTYPADLYRDNNHLNYIGSCKTTSWLGAYMIKHLGIESHSDDPAYAEYWDAYYERYYDYKAELLLEQTGLYEHLLLLYGTDLRAELTVKTGCAAFTEDSMAAAILTQLSGSVEVSATDEVTYANQPCDARLTVWRTDDGTQVLSRGFSYQGGTATMAEQSS